MSGKVHHGPPGSYKTSGAVMDDLPRAVKAGRVVITNVRGLTDRDKIASVCDADPRFDLIHVDTSTSEGLERMRRWFHWAPRGAFLIVDEAQRVWPPEWRDADLARLDYPGGVDQANADGRPENHRVAFDMHRHYNWDFVLTTPDIRKIRPEIRGVCEGAYKHRNRAMVGLKGSYLEAFHSPENNGTSQNDYMSVVTRRIKPWVWGLYASTATGEVSDTMAGRAFWRDPRILGLGVFCVVVIAFVLSRPAPAPLQAAAGFGVSGGPDSGAVADRAASGRVAAGPGRVAAGGVSRGGVDTSSPPLNGWRLVVVGDAWREAKPNDIRVWFKAERNGAEMRLTGEELRRMGYRWYRLANCGYRVVYRQHQQIVGCAETKGGRGAPMVGGGGFAAG